MTKPKPEPGPEPNPSRGFSVRGGDLHLVLADDVRFRVHSHFFTRESKIWRKELTGSEEESSEESSLLKGTATNPVKLKNEKPEDFKLFLQVFYNQKYGDYSHVTVEEWKPILRCAHKWGFPEVKALAIRFLEGNKDLGTAERIVLYQENKIPGKYLLPHFTELVSREKYLGREESHTLGVENLWLIFQARERLRVHSNKDSDHPSPLRKGVNEKEIKDIVVSTFKISLTEEEPTPGSTTLNDRMKDFAAGRNETVPGYQRWEEDSDLGDEDSEDWDESSSDIESLESEAWDGSTNFPGSFPS